MAFSQQKLVLFVTNLRGVGREEIEWYGRAAMDLGIQIMME